MLSKPKDVTAVYPSHVDESVLVNVIAGIVTTCVVVVTICPLASIVKSETVNVPPNFGVSSLTVTVAVLTGPI